MTGATTPQIQACPVCGTPMVRVITEGTTATRWYCNHCFHEETHWYCNHCFHDETHAPAKKQNGTQRTVA